MEDMTGFIALGILIIINIVLVAFTYGKLSQSVKDLTRRTGAIEDKYVNNGKDHYAAEADLEGRVIRLETKDMDRACGVD